MVTLSRAELKVYIHFLCGFISSQPARTTWSIFHVLTPFSIVCRDIKICQSNSKHHCWLPHAEQCWPAAGLQDLCSSSFARGGVGQLAPRPELLVKSVISEYQRAYFKKENMHEHVKLPANVWLMGLYLESRASWPALTFLSSSTDKLFEMTHVDFRNLVLQASLASGSTDLQVLLCRLSTGAPNSRAAPRNCCWLSVIGYSLRKSCRGVLLRCRESRWSRLWVMCGKSWKVGHEWHALHWNSEATNRGARFHLALRRPLVFRSLQVRDHPERPRWPRGGLDILTGIQWLSRQDVLCTVYKNLSTWACCFAAKKGWW